MDTCIYNWVHNDDVTRLKSCHGMSVSFTNMSFYLNFILYNSSLLYQSICISVSCWIYTLIYKSCLQTCISCTGVRNKVDSETIIMTIFFRPCLLGSNMVNYPWLAESWPNNNLNQNSKDATNCCTGTHDSTDRYYNSKSLLTSWQSDNFFIH